MNTLRENNQSLTEIKSSFTQAVIAHQTLVNDIETKLTFRRKQIERLEKRLKQLPPYPQWTEILLRPIINQIKPYFPEWNCDDDQLIPMGLGSRVSVFFTHPKNEYKYIYIVFVPVDLTRGELNYETGEFTTRFAKDTIGEINGFNRKTKLIESIDELIQFLQSQIVHN